MGERQRALPAVWGGRVLGAVLATAIVVALALLPSVSTGDHGLAHAAARDGAARSDESRTKARKTATRRAGRGNRARRGRRAAARSARADAPATVGGLVRLVNAERRRHDLDELDLEPRLARAARDHSADMVRHRYFSHTGRDGSSLGTRVRRTGYLETARRWKLGETLAWGAGERASNAGLVGLLMGSPSHRAVLLDPDLREIGIGIVARAPERLDGDMVARTATLVLGSARRSR